LRRRIGPRVRADHALHSKQTVDVAGTTYPDNKK
jgi:hypothetical protein